MKIYFTLLLILFYTQTNIFPQVDFIPHTIFSGRSKLDSPNSVYSIDVDMDVISTSSPDNKIAWYENDGNEIFTPHIITSEALAAYSIYAIDVDSVGDIDVLSASFADDKIAWYENLGPTPTSLALMQNYPNPFNPSTKISYQIQEVSFVTLKVYDVLGNEIETLVNTEKPAGTYEITWNAIDLPSGVYFYRIVAGDFVETKKMILTK